MFEDSKYFITKYGIVKLTIRNHIANHVRGENVSEKTLSVERKNMKPGVYVVEIKVDKVYRSKLVIQ